MFLFYICSVEIGEDLFLRKLMWIPMNNVDVDRHHHMFFKCDDCKPLLKACQFFGHQSDIECHAPTLDTIYDKPVCSSVNCAENDFMKPTHCLVQTFCDENYNRVTVHFECVQQAELFFVKFPAKQCLDSDVVWCRFLAVIHFFISLESINSFFPTELVVTKKVLASGYERLYFVTGVLSDHSG